MTDSLTIEKSNIDSLGKTLDETYDATNLKLKFEIDSLKKNIEDAQNKINNTEQNYDHLKSLLQCNQQEKEKLQKEVNIKIIKDDKSTSLIMNLQDQTKLLEAQFASEKTRNEHITAQMDTLKNNAMHAENENSKMKSKHNKLIRESCESKDSS